MTPAELIDFLKEERERQGLSQREVGLCMDPPITQAAVSQIESNKRANPDTLRKYADALGLAITYKSEWHIEQKE